MKGQIELVKAVNSPAWIKTMGRMYPDDKLKVTMTYAELAEICELLIGKRGEEFR